MEFTYEALNRQGQSITGKVVADNTSEAYEKLREAGVVVTNLTENKAKAKKKKGKKIGLCNKCLHSLCNGDTRTNHGSQLSCEH